MPRTIRFHLDEHCPHAIGEGLRRRGIDVTTSTEAGLLQAPDVEHLAFGLSQGWGRATISKEGEMSRKKPTPRKDDEDEELVVLCFKVLVMPRPMVPGCSKVPCSACGQPVWISPATLAHVADKPHRISCAECVARDGDPDTQVMAPSEGQIAEMVANDPTLTPAKIRRKLPASNPAKRKAAFDEILRRTREKKRTDN